MRIKRVDHIGIAVDNMKQLKNIFTEVLGLSVGHEEIYLGTEDICFLPVGDTEIELCASITPDGETARLVTERGTHIEHLAFEVDDIEAAMEEIKSKQIPLLQEEPIPGARGSRVVFLDPRATNNILIELVQSAK